MFADYHAVSIKHSRRCCNAAKELDDQRFLSPEAPSLPLPGCSNPSQCQCRYRHHTDRREDLRRDADHGLPDRGYVESNRRIMRSGRRVTDAA